MFHARTFAPLALAFLIAGGANAERTSEGTGVAAELSNLEFGRLLVRTGRFEHAKVFLEQAQPANEDEQVERLFLLGRIDMRLGMPDKAAQRFEAILALRPELTRVRLELAQAYYHAGLDDKARHHFSSSLAQGLPSTVEAAVEDFLHRIDARKRWSVSFSAAMLPETRRPDRETILIGNIPFRLNEDARAPSGIGALFSGGVWYSPRMTNRVRGVVAASAASKLYKRSNWNELRASGELGLTRLFDQGTASGGIRAARVWTGGEPERVSLGPWARARWQVSSSTRLDIALNADRQRYDSLHTRDGWRLRAGPRLVHAFNGQTSIEVEPVLETVTGKERHHDSRLIGLGTTLSHSFAGGLSVSLSASRDTRRHAGPDPLFGTTREDRSVRLGVRLQHRSLRYRDFTPYVGYSLERSRSSIPLHEHRIRGLVGGVSRTF